MSAFSGHESSLNIWEVLGHEVAGHTATATVKGEPS